MHFICPSCSQPGLHITHAIELPASADSDEVTLQVISCASCSFRGAALYEESRRGSLFEEAWRHEGYCIDAATQLVLIDAIDHCPAPAQADCSCPSHQKLNRVSSGNGLYSLEGVQITGVFPMRQD